jgi:hypothetical protein
MLHEDRTPRHLPANPWPAVRYHRGIQFSIHAHEGQAGV